MANTTIPVELSSTPSIVDGGNATAITIDSSENVLVNTTNATPYNNNSGTTADNAFVVNNTFGFTAASAYNNSPLLLNRTSTDGAIIALRKDGTAVGSIGTGYGSVDIKGGTSGLLMGNSAVLPVNGSGTLTDGSYDIGLSSFQFKDLYLSGGVNFGATGGAVSSKTLDDYEEGTWTPSVGSGTVTAANSTYTKIGRLVHVVTRLSTFSETAAAQIQITGLPYTLASSNRNIGSGWGNFSEQNMHFYAPAAGTSTLAYYGGSNYQTATYASLGGTGADVIIKLTYEAA